VGIGKVPKPALPLVAIPTTAGTGSEATIFTIITDTGKDVKMLIGSPHAMPAAALVDPDLTLSMPPGITAATGLDALTHAIESYVSVKAQPLSQTFSLQAVRLIQGNLLRAHADGGNVEARTNVMLGSLMAGIAFSNASVAMVHGMSRPIGAYFHVAHGVANAALLGPVMEFSLSGTPAKYADVAMAMGVDMRGMTDLQAAQAGLGRVKALIEALNIPSLKGLGIERGKLDKVVRQMAADALASGSPGNNPRIPNEQEIVDLYYSAYE
jgi:alcohol dehydrogenase